MSEKKRRARYTLEFKLEAVRLVKGGQAAAVTAKMAEAVRFELTNVVKRCRFSRPVQSTTLPRFLRGKFYLHKRLVSL